MAELTQKEKLQPSLLDRLTDDSPQEALESRENRVLSLQRLRECVLRDLGWLLNTENHEAVEDLSDYPKVASSVINYGIPTLSGLTASGLDLKKLEGDVRSAIIHFEPRILKDSLFVRALNSSDLMSRKTLSFEIQGELWAQPVPLKMYLRTELDLETGAVSIAENPT
ncbi:MAG: type VI secretion system baseplate subunit TssE [Pirellula sp.]|nr:type VI secretion system baseplate subunit TssE [Pirellula sp.]